VARPYGIRKKTATKSSTPPRRDDPALKIRLLGKDGAPLSMQDIRDCLFEAARRLQPLEGTHRAKRATLYVTLIDEHGKPVVPADGDTWEIFAYECAADSYDRR
jgi:hypothetical protein